MIKIIICDDDRLYCEKLRTHISCIFFDKDDVIFECYSDSQELVDTERIEADLIFLDITMPKINGIDVAKRLRARNIDSEIIFVTEREDMVYRGYEVRAFAYLLKSQVKERMEETIERYLQESVMNKKKYLLAGSSKNKKRMELKKIKYLMSDKRKIRVVLNGSNVTEEFYMKMCELERELKGAGFIRCHQSYLVNMSYIVRKEGNTLILNGDEKIPVSRKYSGEVTDRMKE